MIYIMEKINLESLQGEALMKNEQIRRHKILIADDSEINRAILIDMLKDEYDILEAEDGEQAMNLLEDNTDLSLLLLDIVMPKTDGMGVLEKMHENGLINEIPVIMISADRSAANIERAYDLGATDFINRPFDARIVHRRVVNTILLYAKQKKLTELVIHQIYEKERQSKLMIDILSHIVEFRNGESGLHVQNVRNITELLLRKLMQKSDQYSFSSSEIATICTASALHDIGKIAIDESILNKPGKLTKEEFEVMKEHSLIGAGMLENMPFHKNDTLVQTAYKICRWHHERYDGKGYPDGLKGDDIPMCAQVVALADVYDALTSDRVYKKALPSKVAVDMICAGECGSFNPLLLECIRESEEMLASGRGKQDTDDISMVSKGLIEEMLSREENAISYRTIKLLEHERMKYDFFASLTNEIQFEFSVLTSSVTISPYGADKLGISETIKNPLYDERVLSVMKETDLIALSQSLRSTCASHPEVSFDYKLTVDNEERWYRIVAKALWSDDEPSRYMGVIGKAVDIHDSHMMLSDLQKMASSDTLTGLLNHFSAKSKIKYRLTEKPNGKFILAIFDLDRFKAANDLYGHMFGDKVLIHTAKKLCQSIRSGDIVSRVGGDEFLIFLEYKTNPDAVIGRIFSSLIGVIDDFTISLSMGVATTDTVGMDYDALFNAADKALYSVKRSNGGKYCFYDDAMQKMFSVISSIDTKSE